MPEEIEGEYECGACPELDDEYQEEIERAEQEGNTELAQEIRQEFQDYKQGNFPEYPILGPSRGPLSSWRGKYCTFCHRFGQATAFVLALLVWWFTVPTFPAAEFPWVQPLFQASAGVGGIAGFAVWIIGAIAVAIKGDFGRVGELVGPYIKGVFDRSDEPESSSSSPRNQSDPDRQPSSGNLFSGNENEMSESEQVDENLRQRYREKQQELSDARTELAAKENEVTTLKEEREDAHSTLQEVKEEKQQLEQTAGKTQEYNRYLADVGQDSQGLNRLPVQVPKWDLDGDSIIWKGTRWFVKGIELDITGVNQHRNTGTFAFAFLAKTRDEALPDVPKSLKGERAQFWIQQYQEHIYPDPVTVKNPAKFLHKGQVPDDYEPGPGYASARTVFNEDIGAAQTERQNNSRSKMEPVLHLNFDIQNWHYVRQESLGKTVSEWKEDAKKFKQLNDRLNSYIDSLEEEKDDLEHERDLAEREKNLAFARLAEAVGREEALTEAAFKKDRELADTRRTTEFMRDQTEQYQELLGESRKQNKTLFEGLISDELTHFKRLAGMQGDIVGAVMDEAILQSAREVGAFSDDTDYSIEAIRDPDTNVTVDDLKKELNFDLLEEDVVLSKYMKLLGDRLGVDSEVPDAVPQ